MTRWARTHDAEALAARLRRAFAARRGITEKRMFGGVCFLLRGNMLCGTGGPGYMFRVGREQHGAAVRRKGAQPVRIRGRSFEGFVWVDPRACGGRALGRWIALAENHVAGLPAKKGRT
jgi:hypothetical protein